MPTAALAGGTPTVPHDRRFDRSFRRNCPFADRRAALTVFVTGTGFAPLATVQFTNSLQEPVAPLITDVQGELTGVYVDTLCNGQPRTLTAVDGAGNSAAVTFTCP